MELEYSVSQRREGKLKHRMYLILGLYIAFVIGMLVIVFSTVFIALGAVIPFLLYILVLCTWRFVDVEQKYEFSKGHLLVYRKFGNFKYKKKLEICLKNAELIAPIQKAEDELSVIKGKNIYDALPFRASDGAYVIIYTEDGEKKALLIQTIDKTLKALRYYNEATAV